jgi:hypothetical protein
MADMPAPCVEDVSAAARRAGVHRLVFVHIGRPSIAAIDPKQRPLFGHWGVEGSVFLLC